jgi:hypothetical protein
MSALGQYPTSVRCRSWSASLPLAYDQICVDLPKVMPLVLVAAYVDRGRLEAPDIHLSRIRAGSRRP